jgi:hypothetical protein
MERRGDKVVIVKDSDGKVVGSHSDRKKALAQLRALYASESIRKARFSSRSEAGRYAANIRWMGHIPEQVKLGFKVAKPKSEQSEDLADSVFLETSKIIDAGFGKSLDGSSAWKEMVMEQIVAAMIGPISEGNDPNYRGYSKILERLSDFSPLESYGDTPLDQLVSGIINSWAVTSNDANPLALAIQDIAQETFGLTEADDWRLNVLDSELKQKIINDKNEIVNDPELSTFVKDILQIQYQLTQKYFAEKGIKTLEVYRGVEMASQTALLNTVEDALVGAPFRDVEMVYEIIKGGTYRAKASTRPLSAWSFNGDTAEEFAGRVGVLMRTQIPVKDIFSTPQTGFGCLTESEVVVLGVGARDVDYTFPSYRVRDKSPKRFELDFTDPNQVQQLARRIYDDMKASK